MGDACQTEEVADENKSIIWTLVKQVGELRTVMHEHCAMQRFLLDIMTVSVYGIIYFFVRYTVYVCTVFSVSDV